jgi:hypothetical protein
MRIAQALSGACGAATTLGSHAKVAAQILDGPGAFLGGQMNLALGYSRTHANVHFSNLPRLNRQSIYIGIILIIIWINVKQFVWRDL